MTKYETECREFWKSAYIANLSGIYNLSDTLVKTGAMNANKMLSEFKKRFPNPANVNENGTIQVYVAYAYDGIGTSTNSMPFSSHHVARNYFDEMCSEFDLNVFAEENCPNADNVEDAQVIMEVKSCDGWIEVQREELV